ncbi:hypothetical protein SAMN05444392_101552 [Seinonella peptonophila]|uniref:Uncharacterized protein n=1 Tax=Seinonella peptonophila TaxID=112248 RepID=A0A1M4TN66_9BACL|nr:hypothetical protein SAMN05444392_101552 [Seinonella peptonophila]
MVVILFALDEKMGKWGKLWQKEEALWSKALNNQLDHQNRSLCGF